jgi:hypothetical protein
MDDRAGRRSRGDGYRSAMGEPERNEVHSRRHSSRRGDSVGLLLKAQHWGPDGQGAGLTS